MESVDGASLAGARWGYTGSMRRVLSPCFLALACAVSAIAAEAPENAWLVWHRGAPETDAPRRIWLARADGSEARTLTAGTGRMPTWSPDGRWISYHHYEDDSGHVIHSDSSGDRKVCDGMPVFWLQHEGELVCRRGDRYERVDPDTGRRQLFLWAGDFPRLEGASVSISSVGPELRFAVGWSDRYRRRYRGDNGAFKAYHAAVLLDLEDRDRLYFVGPGCEPTISPAGSVVYHVTAEGPTKPDIVRVPIESILQPDYAEHRGELGYQTEVGLGDDDWGHTYFPRVAAGGDASWLTYAATTAEDGADQACHDHETCRYQIFAHRLSSGPRQKIQLTNNRDTNNWPHLFVAAPWDP